MAFCTGEAGESLKTFLEGFFAWKRMHVSSAGEIRASADETPFVTLLSAFRARGGVGW